MRAILLGELSGFSCKMPPRLAKVAGDGCLFLSVEAACGEARQTEICIGKKAQVDGVAVQAYVLQGPADVAMVSAVTEGVIMHGLDIVVLGKGTKRRRKS